MLRECFSGSFSSLSLVQIFCPGVIGRREDVLGPLSILLHLVLRLFSPCVTARATNLNRGTTMATAFIGYVLPFGQMSFWGATVITNLLSPFPSLIEWVCGGHYQYARELCWMNQTKAISCEEIYQQRSVNEELL